MVAHGAMAWDLGCRYVLGMFRGRKVIVNLILRELQKPPFKNTNVFFLRKTL